jgi:hypothetical protein
MVGADSWRMSMEPELKRKRGAYFKRNGLKRESIWWKQNPALAP